MKKPSPSALHSTSLPQNLTTISESLIKSNSTLNELFSSTTQMNSYSEHEESEVTVQDSNDILDENLDKPKRYTVSASKSAGIVSKKIV